MLSKYSKSLPNHSKYIAERVKLMLRKRKKNRDKKHKKEKKNRDMNQNSKLLARLPALLAQIKAGNNSYKLKNEIRLENEAIKNKQETYEKLIKMPRNDGYSIGNLLDYL